MVVMTSIWTFKSSPTAGSTELNFEQCILGYNIYMIITRRTAVDNNT